MANQVIKVNLIPGVDDPMPILHFSQYDNGRTFIVEMYNGEDPFDCDNYNVTLECRKRDNNLVILTADLIDNNQITFHSTEQLCACFGDNDSEIVIRDNNDLVIGSGNIIINVEKSPTCGGIPSETAIDNLKTQVDDITMDYLINNTDEIADIIANKIYPTLEVSGDIATFNTILQLPLVGVTADPLATIITLCGKNFGLLNDDNLDNSQRVTIEYADGGFKLTATGIYARAMYALKTEIGKTYTISFKASGTGNYNRIHFSDRNDWSNSYGYINCDSTLRSYSLTFTATSSILYVGFYLTASGTTGEGIIEDFQIENGSDVTTYEPFNGITKPLDEATTIKTLTGVNNVFTDYGRITVAYKYFPDI